MKNLSFSTKTDFTRNDLQSFFAKEDFLNKIYDLKINLHTNIKMLNDAIIIPICYNLNIKTEEYDLINNVKLSNSGLKLFNLSNSSYATTTNYNSIQNNLINFPSKGCSSPSFLRVSYNLNELNLFNPDFDLFTSSTQNKLINFPYDPIIKKNIAIDGSTPEDARIVIVNNNLQLLYNKCINRPNKYTNIENTRLMHLFDVKSGIETIIGENVSNIFEKNWGLFTMNNQQYTIYSLVPFKVYKLNNENGEECKSEHYYKIFEVLKKKYKDFELYIRNSSKAIFYNNEYYALGHIVIHLDNLSEDYHEELIKNNKENIFFKTYKKLYLGFIYRFKFIDKQFVMHKISDFFSINNKNNLIDYFTDLTIHEDDIFIGHGHDDRKTILSKLNLKKIKFYDVSSDDELKLINLKNIDSIDYTQIIKFKLMQYNIFNELKINLFNTGVEIFNGEMYITCRFLYGSVKNWFGINYIIFIKLKDIFSYSFGSFNIYYYDYLTEKIKKY
jgi:hypothetical protein